MHRIARNLQRAAEGCEKDAERKHAGEQPFLIDAERRHHVAVLRRRAHQNAPARALEQQPEPAEHDRTEPDQEQVVARDILAEEIDRALEAGRAAAEQIVGPPDQHHDILNHQRQAEGREQLEQFRRMIDPPQQHHLDQHADDGHDQRRDDDAAPEAERAGETLGQRERDIGAEHVERAMGEIHDPRHAEDDRQPRRDQEQRRRAGEAGQELNEVEGHGRSGLAQSSAGLHPSRRRFAPPQDEVLLTSPRLRGEGGSPRVANHGPRWGYRSINWQSDSRREPLTPTLSPRRAGRGRRAVNPSDAAFRLRHRSGDSPRPCDRPSPPSRPCRPSARSCRHRRRASTGGRSCGR